VSAGLVVLTAAPQAALGSAVALSPLLGTGVLGLCRGTSSRLPGAAVGVGAGQGGFAPAGLTPSSPHRSSAVDESCQSLLSHSDISYDRTEDDVVRSDPL